MCSSDLVARNSATLRAALELQLKIYVARALHGIAAVEALEGDPELSQRLLGLADRLFAESGREIRDSVAYDIALTTIQTALSETRQSELRAEGAHMTVLDALAAIEGASS